MLFVSMTLKKEEKSSVKRINVQLDLENAIYSEIEEGNTKRQMTP